MVEARFVRVSLIGGRPTGSFAGEIWNTGFSVVDQDGGGLFPGAVKAALPTFDASPIGATETASPFKIDWAWEGESKFTQAEQKTLAGLANTFWAAIKAYAPGDSRLEEIRISAFKVGTTSPWEVVNGANVFALSTPVVGGASAANQSPAQVAMTASLRTAARGAAGRGRMFLPLNSPTLTGTSGLIGTAAKDAIGNATKALIEGVRDIGHLVAIVNKGPATYSDVDNVEVGNYFDIQRRRENSISETYTAYTPELT